MYLGELPPGAFLLPYTGLEGECPAGYVKAQSDICGRASGLSTFQCTGYKQMCIPIPKTPVAPQSAPVNVTVSPQIQTQISPQISPAFQQQFQPSGSPMTAGTTQTSAPSVIPAPAPINYAPPAPPAGPIGINSSSMQPSAPIQLPPAPVPSYTPTPTSYAEPPMQSEQLPPSPLPSSTPAPAAPQVTTATAVPAFDWKILAIIGAGLAGTMALSKRR